ncbi:MAG: Gfo/Idh/MocA family oxidoreductase [Chlorobi bacterium]|nr:Gfo/Idh/MocA family oxidoreductase [Chlorobiota bacterium]
MRLKKVNWGIIGCGNVTELKSGPAFNKIENSKLVSVMRRDAEKVKNYAFRHGVPKWTTSASELINDPEINAVYIATPPSAHAKYAIEAMRAGKPVYVEKPMAATYQECLEMNKVSEETGMPLYVAYYRRTLPGFLKAKEIVDNGTLGTLLFVSVRLTRPANQDEKENVAWRVNPEIAGGGIFYDLASHQLDYLDFLLGPVTGLSGFAYNKTGYYNAEDTVVASLIHKNGVAVSGEWSFVTSEDSKKDIIEIVGTEGRLEFSCFGHTPLLLHKDGDTKEISYKVPENIQFYLIKAIVEELTTGEKLVPSTGVSAARTNRIMEMIVKK